MVEHPTDQICGCGKPLHYSDTPAGRAARAFVEQMVANYGEFVTITVDGMGSYLVPRHFIAAHGVSAREIPELATEYGWEKVG